MLLRHNADLMEHEHGKSECAEAFACLAIVCGVRSSAACAGNMPDLSDLSKLPPIAHDVLNVGWSLSLKHLLRRPDRSSVKYSACRAHAGC